ncbi:unnamed protein product [Alopecurus aequalis]
MAPSSSSSRRSGCGSHLCWLCTTIVILGILSGIIYLLVWLSVGHTAATAVSATLSHFDLVDGPSGGGTLQYNLTVDIRVRNTRRRSFIDYDRAEAQASYAAAEPFGYDPVEPFSLKGHREHTITAVFGGSSAVDNGDTVHTYQRERSEGFYFVKLRLYYRIVFAGYDATTYKKSKISCTLRLPVPNTSSTPVKTQLETVCDKGY